MTNIALSFNEVNFSPVQLNGQIWLSAGELARALGYAKANAVTQVYDRNQDEFSPNMTQLIDNPQSLNLRLRVFSLRGCHLIAMFAKTSVAKQFRKWVLDVLDKEVGQPISKTNKKDRVPLKDAVNLLVGKAKFLNYSEAYKLVHHRFEVESIEDIPFDQLPVAVEYVHKLMGEYVQKVDYIDPELRAFELLASDTTNKIHDWIWSLQEEIKRLKGNIPSYPNFDREEITRAVVSRMVSMSRMLLTIDTITNKPKVQFIPNNSWILDDDNIANIIGDREGPRKEVLPDIVQAAMRRMLK